jgi:mannose-6-phosphate isomerase-like protein (cupin superfamily)
MPGAILERPCRFPLKLIYSNGCYPRVEEKWSRTPTSTKVPQAMAINVVNLKEKANKITELHKYKIIAQLNNYQFKLVKAKREFIWHQHPETDEVFIVIEGVLRINLRKEVLTLHEGEMVVIPKGTEHKPECDDVVCCMLIEPAGTLNTGSAGGSLTDTGLEWI